MLVEFAAFVANLDDLLWSRVVWRVCRNGDKALVAPARVGDLSAFTLRGEKPARAGLERLSELMGEGLLLNGGRLEDFGVGRRETESTERRSGRGTSTGFLINGSVCLLARAHAFSSSGVTKVVAIEVELEEVASGRMAWILCFFFRSTR